MKRAVLVLLGIVLFVVSFWVAVTWDARTCDMPCQVERTVQELERALEDPFPEP